MDDSGDGETQQHHTDARVKNPPAEQPALNQQQVLIDVTEQNADLRGQRLPTGSGIGGDDEGGESQGGSGDDDDAGAAVDPAGRQPRRISQAIGQPGPSGSTVGMSGRVKGAQSRQREREKVLSLELELERLQEMLSLNRTNYLCVQSTGLLQLLKSNPAQAKEKVNAQEGLTAVLRMLTASLQGGPAQQEGVPALVTEAVQLFRQLSDMCYATAWHGTALVVMEDGFIMHHPGVPTLMGDIPMASWLRTYLSSNSVALHPTLVQELNNLVIQWTEIEERVNNQFKLWCSVVRGKSMSQVQQSLGDRLRPDGAQGQFVLHPKDGENGGQAGASTSQSGSAAGVVPDDVSELMTSGCNLVQHNEEFRCLALGTLQSQLGTWDLARFLVCRLSLQDAVQDLSQLTMHGHINPNADRNMHS